MEGRNLGKSRPETARNAVGDRMMPADAALYKGSTCLKKRFNRHRPILSVSAPTDDTLYVPAIAATVI